MKKPIKIILIVLAVIVGLFAALLIWLTATQLNVKTETAVVTRGDNSTAAFAPGDEVSILSWNVGYAGLGEESDFFMDGGKQTRAPSKAIVEKNMDREQERAQLGLCWQRDLAIAFWIQILLFRSRQKSCFMN